jgi:hypothetical protein
MAGTSLWIRAVSELSLNHPRKHRVDDEFERLLLDVRMRGQFHQPDHVRRHPVCFGDVAVLILAGLDELDVWGSP